MLEDLLTLWGKAKSGKLEDCSGHADGVYMDTVEEKAILALKSKLDFRGMFQIDTRQW
jgi:hypothetical protein